MDITYAIRRFCELWCLYNVDILDADDVLFRVNQEKLFEPIMAEEWSKVSSTTEDAYNKLKSDNQKYRLSPTTLEEDPE